MTDDNDTIVIDPCPTCEGRHHYTLKVVRSPVSQFAPGSEDKPRLKPFVRLFACPKHGNNFQATLSLTVQPGSKIKEVEVTLKDDQDG